MENLLGFNYIHKWINHSIKLADALIKIIHKVEDCWRYMKQFITTNKSEINVLYNFRIHSYNRDNLFEQPITDLGSFDFDN